MEIDVVPVEEVLGNVRGLIWIARELCVSRNIDPTQRNLSAVGVAEMAVFNCESQGGHCREW